MGLTIRAKMIGGGRPLVPEILDLIAFPALERNRRFSISFARNDSAVTPSEKSSINTNKTHYALSNSQDEHRTLLSLSPQRELKNAKCPKFEQ